ncbi:MAG: NADH:flavin oxidoreductase/NADH oxidase [Rhizobiales bacterium]|nr:NADH:flavin oxidoreductase/NADH oxidase [Hyphomicrobiales bacterium]
MTSRLFAPIEIGGMVFDNRIAVAPMCQYSADDGSATDWHIQHWMNLALSGAGMVTVEATGVERRGRITHGCLGIYSDDNEATIGRGIAAARRVAPAGTRFGIQLAHAGRKASTQRPWEGGGPLTEHEDPWPTIAPSAIAFADKWHVPKAMDHHDIRRVTDAFVAAAKRAERAGFDFVELHGAHGYLMHEFLSPLSNKREDEYGGPLENRMRFILDIARAVRAALPARMMLGARLSASDWVEGGFVPEEAVQVARALKAEGVAYICSSSGGNSPHQKIPTGPGYQVHFAELIRREAGIATRAVGLIDDPLQAEAIIAGEKADFVALARAMLADPRWPWRAAAMLGARFHAPVQYQRSVGTMEHWGKAQAAREKSGAA